MYHEQTIVSLIVSTFIILIGKKFYGTDFD
jgi:hypothetical protein